MANRRKHESGDSLELLLDTICNAFGGILFLTILLTILLRLSHPKAEESQSVPDAARREMSELAENLDAVLAELESLERSLAVQTQTRARLVDADLEERYQRLEDLRQQHQTLEHTLLESTRAAAATQQQIDTIAAKSEALNRNLEVAKAGVATTSKRLDAERKRRTQSIVPPHSRSSSKAEIALIVRYGKVYQQHRWNHIQGTREPNFDDFVVLGEASGFLRITPKPYRGLSIEENSVFATHLKDILVSHDPSRWHVCLAVWDDSFDQFLTLKKLLVEWGYDIRILALANDEFVSEAHVPDPQVQ